MLNLKLTAGWIMAFIAISLSSFAQTVYEDSVSMGPGYANQVYYSFADGEVLSSSGTNWDIAFRAGTYTSSIRLNGGQGVLLYQLPGDTSAFTSTTDTTGLSGFNVLYDPDTTWELSAFEQNPTGSFNYGWGSYNQTTHLVTGTRAFILKVRDGSYKKIVIEELDLGTWKFRYADIDGSNLVQDSVVVGNYDDKIYIGYSLVDQTVRDFEPVIVNWDIVFTKYMAEDYKGNPWQAVTGILSNLGTLVSEARNVHADDAYANSANYSVDADNISKFGWDWKDLDTNYQWFVVDSLSYFVKSTDDEYYQVWFTNFAGSSTGKVNFSFRKLASSSAVGDNGEVIAQYSVFPNPSAGQFTVLYNTATQVADMTFEMYNLTGQLVYQQQLPAGAGLNQVQIDVNGLNLPAGVYQTTIRNGQVLAQDKLIIAR